MKIPIKISKPGVRGPQAPAIPNHHLEPSILQGRQPLHPCHPKHSTHNLFLLIEHNSEKPYSGLRLYEILGTLAPTSLSKIQDCAWLENNRKQGPSAPQAPNSSENANSRATPSPLKVAVSARDLHGHAVLCKERIKRLLGPLSQIKLSDGTMSALNQLHYLQGVVCRRDVTCCAKWDWISSDGRTKTYGWCNYPNSSHYQ